MFVYDFSFRSLTAAQDGRSVLQNAGVFSQLARAPKQIAEQGCGYVLEVDGPDGADALTLFLSSGVRFRRVFRQFDNGFVEEAGHDLFCRGSNDAAKAAAGEKGAVIRDGPLCKPRTRRT